VRLRRQCDGRQEKQQQDPAKLDYAGITFHAKLHPMRIRKSLIVRLLAAFSFLPGSPALAHDFWIEPQNFRPAVQEQVPIVLRVGQDFTGTSQPMVPRWFSNYSATGPSGTQQVTGFVGDDPAGSFTPDAPGDWVIGYRSTQAFVEIDPPRFNKYLETEGLEWVMEARQERGEADINAREIYSRCAKSLVRVGDEPVAGGFDTVLGYRLELIPERDPYELQPGDGLPLRLIYEGKPLEGTLIIAFTAEDPTRQQRLRTDADGRVVVQLSEAGTWLIKGVHIIELPDTNEQADWESFWASLTFQLGET
jgi:uncharacterized GH25 family protein